LPRLATNGHIAVPNTGQGTSCRKYCYVGLPNRHLTVGPGARIHLLADGFYRAHSIDALFESLARHAGPRTIGVILSGLLKDGSLGPRALKEAGGVALVQRPEDASFKEIPENAIEHDGPIDLIGSVDAIADEICRRVSPPAVETHRIKRPAASSSPANSPAVSTAPIPG